MKSDQQSRKHNIAALLAMVEADVQREESAEAVSIGLSFPGIPIDEENGLGFYSGPPPPSPPKRTLSRFLLAQSSAIMSDLDSSDHSRDHSSYKRITNESHTRMVWTGKNKRRALCCMAVIAICGSFVKPSYFYQPRFLSASRKLPHHRGRPIVYTFYEEVEEGGYGDAEMRAVWEDVWHEAGWEPKVLSLKDARSHPDYVRFERTLRDVPLGEKPAFDRMNYLRYLAMSAVGGGFMSDIDVYPLWPLDDERGDGGRFQYAMADMLQTSLDDATIDLPFNGKFSLLCGGQGAEVPCLMSGSASQWNLVANVLLENGGRHVLSEHWSDMHALQDALRQDAKPFHHIGQKTFDGTGVVKWLLPQERYAWDNKCGVGESMVAVHFSPHSMLSNVNREYWQSPSKYLIRKQIAMAWMARWGEKCLKEESSYRKFLMWQKPSVDVTPLLISTYPDGKNPAITADDVSSESGTGLVVDIMPDVIDTNMIEAEQSAWGELQAPPLSNDNEAVAPQVNDVGAVALQIIPSPQLVTQLVKNRDAGIVIAPSVVKVDTLDVGSKPARHADLSSANQQQRFPYDEALTPPESEKYTNTNENVRSIEHLNLRSSEQQGSPVEQVPSLPDEISIIESNKRAWAEYEAEREREDSGPPSLTTNNNEFIPSSPFHVDSSIVHPSETKNQRAAWEETKKNTFPSGASNDVSDMAFYFVRPAVRDFR